MKLTLRQLLVTAVCSFLCATVGGTDDHKSMFEWTDKSREALKSARVFWDFMESGAPLIVLNDELSKEDALKSVQIAFLFAELPPGDYEYLKPSHPDFEHNEFVTGSPERQVFHFDSKHLTLLRHMSVRESFLTDEGDMLVGIDPKRPYGDFTYFEAEMARILERPHSLNDKNQVVLTKEVEAEMTKLHDEMVLAVQVFLHNAKLKPGRYRDMKYGAWERV